jgi:hypothetical protein
LPRRRDKGTTADKRIRRQDIRRASGETLMPKTTRFDAADYLESEERQVAYITAALETRDAKFCA